MCTCEYSQIYTHVHGKSARAHTHTPMHSPESMCVWTHTLACGYKCTHLHKHTSHIHTHINISSSTKLISYWCLQPMLIRHILIFYSSIYRFPKYFSFFRSVSMRSHPHLNKKLCSVCFISIQLPAPFWLELFVLPPSFSSHLNSCTLKQNCSHACPA